MTLSSPILQQKQVLNLLRTAKYRQLEGVDQTVAYDIQGTVKNVPLSGCRNIIACNIGIRMYIRSTKGISTGNNTV